MPHIRQRQVLFYSLLIFSFLLTSLLLSDLSPPHSHALALRWDRGPSNYFWLSDKECKRFSTRFTVRNSLPTRALVSYPGSGNTWIRYLVEAATGVFTGSIFNDKSILRAGHLGEARDFKDGTTIMQKTHHRALFHPLYKNYGLAWRRRHVTQFSGGGVLVIRNPYKAILSYWNFKMTRSHTKTVAAESLHSEKFQEFVRVGAERWLEVIQDWLDFSSSCHLIFYEELKEDPTGELRRLLQHLKLETDEGRLECIVKHSAGSFHRANHQEEDPFTEQLHQLLDEHILTANNILRRKTGRELPLHKYEYFNRDK